VCFSKTDRFTEFPPLRGCSARFLSLQTEDGVPVWLDDVLGDRFSSRPEDPRNRLRALRASRGSAGVVELQRDRKLAPPVTPASVVGPRPDCRHRAVGQGLHYRAFEGNGRVIGRLGKGFHCP